jgi:hypothetical protein
MNDDELEFLRQIEELNKMIDPIIDPFIEYRLYYDAATGDPFCFSMENNPGSAYIRVTKELYETANINEIKVINGRILFMTIDSYNKVKYVRGPGIATVKNDIQFVVDDDYEGETSTWKSND